MRVVHLHLASMVVCPHGWLRLLWCIGPSHVKLWHPVRIGLS